ncbi:unnamed protein product [Rotaria sp. Silwood1]|nr:unnamed protein product [Rotaria sp. Silwood1]CAF1606677.1 unnamed protein product [Rotaria sp. Silwood1]
MTNQKPIEIVTLGRPFRLGMLYDIRSDMLITGATLWNKETLDKNTDKSNQPYTDYEVIATDSLQDKAHALGVEGSLKLSLLGGLVNVSGSAKYAEDSQKTNHVTRLTLKYTTTTEFEQLTMQHLGKGNLNHPDLHDADIATHVVTGILYGAEAFFVFDRTVSEEENKTEVAGTLQAMIKKIPKCEIEADVTLDLNDNEKKCINNLNCKFYGDFRLKKNPSTFEDAIKLYNELPELLGEGQKNVIPKKVWLYPLHLLDSKAMKIVRDISTSTIDYSIGFLEKLHSLEIRASDLTKSTVFTYFNHMRKHLLDFVARLSEFERDLKKKMVNLLPKIRGAGAEESDLLGLFKEVDSSPFNERTLTSWLEDKEKEVALIKTFTAALTKDKNLYITVKSSSLDDVIGDIDYDYILCLSFCFNVQNEPQLTNMHNHLHKDKLMSQQESSAWFKDHNILSKIRTNLRQFIEFASANITNKNIRFVVNEEYSLDGVKRAEVILYDNGSIKKGFIMPSKPDAPYAKTVTHNSVTLEWTDVQSGSEQVKKYKIMYRKHSSDNHEKWNEVLTNNNSKIMCISNLPSKTAFVFKVQSITGIGLSPVTDVSELVETLGMSKLNFSDTRF